MVTFGALKTALNGVKVAIDGVESHYEWKLEKLEKKLEKKLATLEAELETLKQQNEFEPEPAPEPIVLLDHVSPTFGRGGGNMFVVLDDVLEQIHSGDRLTMVVENESLSCTTVLRYLVDSVETISQDVVGTVNTTPSVSLYVADKTKLYFSAGGDIYSGLWNSATVTIMKDVG